MLSKTTVAVEYIRAKVLIYMSNRCNRLAMIGLSNNGA